MAYVEDAGAPDPMLPGCWRSDMRLCVKASAWLVAMMLAAAIPDASAHATSSHPNCSSAARSAGTCLGFTAYGQENPYLAAISGALLNGQVRQAKTFAAVASAHLSAADNEKVHAALSGATQSPAAADQLGSLLSEHNAASADAAATVIPAANPPQAANGQTAAVGLFNWLLHNSYHVPIYYGYCTINGCTTVGNWDFTQTASVYYSSTKGMSYSGEIYYGSGTKATLSGVKVRLYRDITNSSDTYEASLSCPTSGSSFDCTSEFGTGQGNYVGHWYYLQLDIISNPSGYPTSAFQMQTRRYLVVSNPSDWEFKSYLYYGD